MLVKCCIQYDSKFGKLSSGHRTGKGRFSFQSQRKAKSKNAQTIAQFSKPGLAHEPMNHELPDVQAGFRKGRTRNQIPNIRWIIKKAKEFQKNIYFSFIEYAKVFDCVGLNKLKNSSRDGNNRPPDLPPEKSVCRPGAS